MRKFSDIHWASAVVLACVVAYLNTFWNGFVWDDWDFIVGDASIRNLGNVPSYFTNPSLHGMYPPLATSLYSVTYAVWGLNPVGYHLNALLLHTLCSVAVYLIGKELLGKREYSAVAALLFAVHPAHTERVADMTASFDMLAVTFTLLSLHQYLKGRTNLSLGLFLIGLFSSEASLTLPFLIVFHQLAYGKKDARKAAPYFITLALFMLLRTEVLGSVARTGEYATGGLTQSILAAPGIVVAYIGQMTVFQLTVCHTPQVPDSPLTPGFILPGAAVIMVLYLAITAKNPGFKYSLLWFGSTLIPYMNLLPQVTAMADRYLYLPSAGFCLLGGAIAKKLHQRNKAHGKALAIAIAALLAFYTLETIKRNRDWRTEETLWSSTVKTNPGCGMAYINRGDAYLSQNRFDEAIKQYSLALNAKEGPKSGNTPWKSWNNLGIAYAKKGECTRALEAYGNAIRESPGNIRVLLNKATTQEECGRNQEASETYQTILAQNPENRWAREGLKRLEGR